MSTWILDADTAIAIVAAALAMACLWAAVQGFRRGATGAAIGSLVGAAALAFVGYLFATFTLRLF